MEELDALLGDLGIDAKVEESGESKSKKKRNRKKKGKKTDEPKKEEEKAEEPEREVAQDKQAAIKEALKKRTGNKGTGSSKVDLTAARIGALEKKQKDKKKEKLEKLGPYKPIDRDPKVDPFLALRNGEMKLLASLDRAATYLHFLDALGEEEVQWDLRMPLATEIDYFHVAERIGEHGVVVMMEPLLTVFPGTLRQRNLPAENRAQHLPPRGATLFFLATRL